MFPHSAFAEFEITSRTVFQQPMKGYNLTLKPILSRVSKIKEISMLSQKGNCKYKT